MAEKPSNPPEMPASLRAMEQEFRRIGDKVKIRLQYGGNTAPKYINASDLKWIFETPRGATRPMWLLGFNAYKDTYKQLPQVLAPVASYGESAGKLFILPIKANQKALFNASKIFNDLANAASSPEIAERLRTNWERPLQGASKLIEAAFPTGRAQTASPQLSLAAAFGLVRKSTEPTKSPFQIQTNKPIGIEDARFFAAVSQLDPATLKQAVSALTPPELLALEQATPKAKRGTKQFQAESSKLRSQGVEEAAKIIKAYSERQVKPGTPALRGVQSQDLMNLLLSAGLPPETPEANRPINRERMFEERRYRKQRAAETGERQGFRGYRSSTPAQRDLLEAKLEEARKAIAIQPDDTPQIRKLKQSLAAQVRAAVPVGVRGGTITAKTREGIVPRQIEQLSEPISRQDAGRLIDLLSQAARAAAPRRQRLRAQAPGTPISAIMPTTPEGAPVPDIGEILRRRLPSVLTTEQAAQVGAPRALARATTELATDIQDRLTLQEEEKLRVEIEKTLREVAGSEGQGGLSKVSKKALAQAQSPEFNKQQAQKLVKLAISTGSFGSQADIAVAKADFVSSFVDEIQTLNSIAEGDTPGAGRARAKLRQIESRVGPLKMDPGSLASKAKSLYDVDLAGRAIRALTAKHSEISQSSLARTNPLADKLAYESGVREEDKLRRAAGAPEVRQTISRTIKMGVPPTIGVGSLRRLAGEAVTTMTGRTPPPGRTRIVENGGMPRSPAPVDLSAGGRFRVGPETGGLQPANPQPPVPGSGLAVPFAFGLGSSLAPLQIEQLRTLQPPRRFSVAELAALPDVQGATAPPTSVAPGLRRERESLLVRSDVREALMPKPKKARMRVSRGR